MRYEISVEETDPETREGNVHRVVVCAPTELLARKRAEDFVKEKLSDPKNRHVRARESWPWYGL